MLIDIKDAPDKAQRIFVQLIDVFEEQEINPTPLNYYIGINITKAATLSFVKKWMLRYKTPLVTMTVSVVGFTTNILQKMKARMILIAR